IQNSDSFCFNAHKTLGTPLSTSILLIKDEKDLYKSFSNKADYLYQTDNDDYNLGQTSFECGRRNNALKFWTLWKSVGTNGIAKMVEQNYHLADIARNYIRNNSDYKLYSYNDSLSVCFNYKNFDAIELCSQLYNKNKLMVSHGKHKGENFVRLVTINRENSEKNILDFFKIIEKFADNNMLVS
ncbi:MAG: pyridoxal-dependent decarboxylase, partial [Flavobacteriales bacterium]